MSTNDCIFCRIVAGAIPCKKLLEDEHLLAFMDIGPLAEGHALLIPKAHAATIEQLPPDTASRVGAVLPRMAAAVQRAAKAPGLNILQNNGAVSGQVVPHVHFHFIPRREGDGLGYRWNAGQYGPGRMDAVHAAIIAELA